MRHVQLRSTGIFLGLIIVSNATAQSPFAQDLPGLAKPQASVIEATVDIACRDLPGSGNSLLVVTNDAQIMAIRRYNKEYKGEVYYPASHSTGRIDRIHAGLRPKIGSWHKLIDVSPGCKHALVEHVNCTLVSGRRSLRYPKPSGADAQTFFSTDGNYLILSTSRPGNRQKWEPEKVMQFGILDLDTQRSFLVDAPSLVFLLKNKNQKTLAYASDLGQIYTSATTEKGKHVFVGIPTTRVTGNKKPFTFEVLTPGLNQVHYRQRDQKLVLLVHGNRIEIRDARNGVVTDKFELPQAGSATVSPNANWVAIANRDRVTMTRLVAPFDTLELKAGNMDRWTRVLQGPVWSPDSRTVACEFWCKYRGTYPAYIAWRTPKLVN